MWLCILKEKAYAKGEKNGEEYLDDIMYSVREYHLLLHPVGNLHGGKGHEDQHDNGKDQR